MLRLAQVAGTRAQVRRRAVEVRCGAPGRRVARQVDHAHRERVPLATDGRVGGADSLAGDRRGREGVGDVEQLGVNGRGLRVGLQEGRAQRERSLPLVVARAVLGGRDGGGGDLVALLRPLRVGEACGRGDLQVAHRAGEAPRRLRAIWRRDGRERERRSHERLEQARSCGDGCGEQLCGVLGHIADGLAQKSSLVHSQARGGIVVRRDQGAGLGGGALARRDQLGGQVGLERPTHGDKHPGQSRLPVLRALDGVAVVAGGDGECALETEQLTQLDRARGGRDHITARGGRHELARQS